MRDIIASYCFTNNCSIGIAGIEYGIEDKIKWFDYPLGKINTSKLRYDKNDDGYFISHQARVYLNECTLHN